MNIHFWELINGSWTKLTIKPGQELFHKHFERFDDEPGYRVRYTTWYLTEDSLELQRWTEEIASGIDGTINHKFVQFWDTTTKEIQAEMPDDNWNWHPIPGIYRPNWKEDRQ